MTNREKYGEKSHEKYVKTKQCVYCTEFICERTPVDFLECPIENKEDYAKWLAQEYEEG